MTMLGIENNPLGPLESNFLEHPERCRVPLPYGRPQSVPSRAAGSFDNCTRCLCGITVAMVAARQLEGNLGLVECTAPDDQTAVSDKLAGAP
jgi:hypothetical protein